MNLSLFFKIDMKCRRHGSDSINILVFYTQIISFLFLNGNPIKKLQLAYTKKYQTSFALPLLQLITWRVSYFLSSNKLYSFIWKFIAFDNSIVFFLCISKKKQHRNPANRKTACFKGIQLVLVCLQQIGEKKVNFNFCISYYYCSLLLVPS